MNNTAYDSINRQQPENQFHDDFGKEAVDRIKRTVKKNSTCFFCTAFGIEGSHAARPMGVQHVDDEGNLWFLSSIDSHKNRELDASSSVRLFFQGSEHSDFLELTGTATVSQDRQKIDELWEPLMKTWFTGGKDDPRITVIKFTPTEGYYWDNKHGAAIAFIKMMTGGLLGKTLDDSIQGRIRPQGTH